MTHLLAALLIVGLTANFGQAQQEKPQTKQNPAAAKQTNEKHAFLGLKVEPVPEALASQLPGVLTKGQGVLVEQVVKDSPAAKAGLQANDILLTYGEQKIASPMQFVKMVRQGKAGHEVAVSFVRAGKQMNCKVTTAEAQPRPQIDQKSRDQTEATPFRKDGMTWESFDAMRLTRTDATHWKAEIEYRNKEGKKDTKAFAGTREEIRKSIRAEKDLPANERHHLLRALNMQEPMFPFPTIDELNRRFFEDF